MSLNIMLRMLQYIRQDDYMIFQGLACSSHLRNGFTLGSVAALDQFQVEQARVKQKLSKPVSHPEMV